MNRSTVTSLAVVLFKSYFRARQPGRRSPLSSPRVILLIDAALFAAPFLLVSYLLPSIANADMSQLQPAAVHAIVGLPVILASVILLAGIVFELGQGSGLASSEAVNWLPVSPQEYVVASSISLCFAYSPLLCLALGITIPLSLSLSMSQVVPYLVGLTTLAFLWGAVIVEALRAAMNRISTTVYRRSGRLGIFLRLILIIILFVAVQVAFNPYILYAALSVIVTGINLAWFIPVVWPAAALVSLLESDATSAAVFILLSLLFTLLLIRATSWLRAKYWSPMPISITVSTSTKYVPKERSLLWLDPLGFALASKELKSLTRRRDMARFLATPVILVVVTIIWILTAGASSNLASSGISLLLLGEASTTLPITLSSISIGQEGRPIANIYMLPISADELIKGKLFLSWIISGAGIFALALLIQLLVPLTPLQFLTALVALAFIIVVEGYLGLGTASRYPDFTVGPRARYITIEGFAVALALGLIATVATLAPLIVYLKIGFLNVSQVFLIIASTVAVGAVLLVLARSYCRRGVENFLSNMEA